MPTAVQPDIELAVVNYFASVTALTNATNGSPAGLGAKVGTEVPAQPSWPFLVVILQDDGFDYPGWLTHPRMQLDCWADTKKKAREAAFAAVAAWFDIAGTRNGAVLSGPEVLSGPRWLPDATLTPARPRYTTDLRLAAHPVP